MPGRSFACCLLCLLPMLSACQPESRGVDRQVVVEWPAQQRVFVADRRVGRVQSFSLPAAGAPLLSAQTSAIGPAAIADIRLEAAREQLWVLADNGVYVYAARSLRLQKYLPLAARRVAALRLGATGVLLVDGEGAPLARIDSETLVASWPASVDRGRSRL